MGKRVEFRSVEFGSIEHLEICAKHDSPVLFAGEVATCSMCGEQIQTDPAVESDWRGMVADGEVFYFCPKHFPPDGSGPLAFRAAYDRILRHIVATRNQRARR